MARECRVKKSPNFADMPRMLLSSNGPRKKGRLCIAANRGHAHFSFSTPRARPSARADRQKNRHSAWEDTRRIATPRCRQRSRALANLERAHYTPTQGSRAKPAFASPASALPLAARPAAAPPLGFPRKRWAPPPRLRRRPSPRAPLRSPLSTALPSRAPLTRCTLRGPPYLRRSRLGLE